MILTVLQLQTGLFNTDDRLDLTIHLPINTTGIDDSTVYISDNQSANKGPFRLNYSLA